MKPIQMRRIAVQLGLVVLLFLSLVWPAQASQTIVTVSAIKDKFQGEQVKIGGSSITSEVIVKVFDPSDRIYFFRSVPVQSQQYETGFTLASDAQLGRYTVIVGYEKEVLRTSFLVLKPGGNENVEYELEDALNNLKIGFRNGDTWESVTSDFYLLSVGKHDTSVSWTSSRPDVIAIGEPQGNELEGQVKRQEEERSVVVTATVSKNNKSAKRPFLLIVKSKSTSKLSVTENVRTVNVIGEHGGFSNPLNIIRIVLSDQTRIDKTIMDEATADQVIDKSRMTGEQVSRIVMDHLPNDIPEEIAVQIAWGSVSSLANHGMDIQLESETAVLTLENAILQQMKQQSMDLYFRIVPVRNDQKRQDIANQITQETMVQQAAGSGRIAIVGTPQKIETNYFNYRTKLLIPFNGIVPLANQASFLNTLRVFIEHSDGEKKLVEGKIVYLNGLPYGIVIEIDKFSTFTLVQLNQRSGSGSSSSGTTSPGGGQPSSPNQETTATGDGNRIIIEHGGSNEGIDKGRFEVTINGKKVPIAEVIIENGKIILVLEQPIRKGDAVAVAYLGDETKESDQRMNLFSRKLENTGQHQAYVLGYPDETFKPDQSISRAEMAALLSRVYEGAQGESSSYPDVSAEHWGYKEISNAQRTGLMKGMPDGTFQPERPIKRAEMASIVSVWKDLRETAATRASDTQGHWGEQTIARVMAAGLMEGYPDGSFKLEGLLTRAEAVTIINRLLQRGPLYGVTVPSWSDVTAIHWAFGNIEEASGDHRFERRAEGGEMKSK
ncbi:MULTISPECIES: S-layer homology domain-containing protein [unclassified Paenibacillus]|uniref:S-layer homology domain-containing protein n=1 Tax=unclassified Paenibacillus TaxID=185978 RepID=UPI003632C794